jgi:hypothetical protein
VNISHEKYIAEDATRFGFLKFNMITVVLWGQDLNIQISGGVVCIINKVLTRFEHLDLGISQQ